MPTHSIAYQNPYMNIVIVGEQSRVKYHDKRIIIKKTSMPNRLKKTDLLNESQQALGLQSPPSPTPPHRKLLLLFCHLYFPMRCS